MPGDYVISTHCHNDLGLGGGQHSLAAVRPAPARWRSRSTASASGWQRQKLEEVVAAASAPGPDFFTVDGQVLDTNVKAEELAKTSRLVSRPTGYPVQYNKAVVGRNAFAHEAGIHQHGMLEDASTYEIMDPASVGQGRDADRAGQALPGRHAFADTLEKMGITIQGDASPRRFARFQKELADRRSSSPTPTSRPSWPRARGGSVGRAPRPELDEFRGSNIGPASSTGADP